MSNKSILIVEDEAIIALNLKETLIDLGYHVCGIANNKCSTMKILEAGIKPDLILMDIYLKGPTTGIELAKLLRHTLPSAPIIFVTANSELSTIKNASSANAYGYLLKPIKDRELKANVEMALHKSASEKSMQVQLSKMEHVNQTLKKKLSQFQKGNSTLLTLKYGFVFDTEERTLYLKGTPVKLTAKEQEFLYLLASGRHGMVSREQIEHALWPDSPPGDGAFRSLLYRIRQKLHKNIIINSSNIGYRLALE